MNMKVLIQNVATRRYFSEAGGWVARAEEGRDFGSILPAYQYARQHTNGPFQVVLFCEDDQYHAVMADGCGTASTSATSTKEPKNQHTSLDWFSMAISGDATLGFQPGTHCWN